MDYQIKKREKLRVFISGQKYFGAEVYRLCKRLGCEIVGVSCPASDKYLLKLAVINKTPVIPSGSLNADTMPDGVDLGIAAHSFDYIGRKTRLKTEIGWIGYHPSLLPRHRGRSAVEWAVRMRDVVTGGTVYWLNAGIDRGDIFLQDWIFIDPALYAGNPRAAAATIWRDELLPMGVRLLGDAIRTVLSGRVIRVKQDPRFSTFEPSTDVKDIFRPDLELLPAASQNGLI
jgi:methionyl-tRNA formyltransferase